MFCLHLMSRLSCLLSRLSVFLWGIVLSIKVIVVITPLLLAFVFFCDVTFVEDHHFFYNHCAQPAYSSLESTSFLCLPPISVGDANAPTSSMPSSPPTTREPPPPNGINPPFVVH